MTNAISNEENTQAKPDFYSRHRLKKSDFSHHLFIESYGVKIGISSNTADGIENARSVVAENLPICFQEIEETKVEHHFLLVRNLSEKDSLYKNGEKILAKHNRENLLEYLGSNVRLTVAEYAAEHVFVHAGVVSWNGKTIMIPGKSFSGKTTLTAALVKRGALYYSDEYAVLDKEGFVHPFPKKLSIRGEIDDYTQIEHSVESLGGKAASEKSVISAVLITEYKPSAKWNPEILSAANGIMEIIKNTVPIRQNPEFTLEVLNQVAGKAVFVKSKRGDVSGFTKKLIDFIELNCK